MPRKHHGFLLLFLVIVINLLINSSCQKRVGIAPLQSLTYNLGTEPGTIDPALCTADNEANVIIACFEGLMRLDGNNKAMPGVAESYIKMSDTKYIFKLRDTKWSDGKTVTANDFEYAWKRVLAPETGAQYAYQMYCLKNGEEYNTKKSTADTVGVKAVDEKTLEVTLNAANPYFLELLGSPVYMPVREDIVKANPEKWAVTPTIYIGNGPFKVTSWRPKEAIELIRNVNYYDEARIKLNKLIFTMVEDPDSYLSAWEEGEVDIIESPPFSELQRLKSENKVIVSPELATYFYLLNNKKKPLDDKRVRKALTYAIDRKSIIRDIIKNQAIPATAFVSKGIPDSDITRDFRDVGGEYFKSEGQVAEAQKLLSEAGYPKGKGFPTLTIAYNNSPSHAVIAQAVQDMWRKNLGVNVILQGQEWEIFNNLKKNGDFEIARHGWTGDYVDPMTFLDLFRTGGGNNNPKYSSTVYDNLLDSAKREVNAQKRMRLLHDAESVLMDDMPIIPIFFYTSPVLVKPYVKGISKSPLGFIYFDQAYVEGKL